MCSRAKSYFVIMLLVCASCSRNKTKNLKNYSIVAKQQVGFTAINRQGKVLFQVFPFDNGPDYPSEGLFRIIEDGKIGYADTLGTIRIKPQYPCAFPFDGGKAKVALNCSQQKDGEHSVWISEKWFYIDKSGSIVK